MHKLIDYICEELDELERKADKDGKLSMAEIQYGDTLAHFKKNLLKAEEMTEGEGYSSRGWSYARGSYADGSYDDGMGNMGGSYEGRSYARGGRNGNRGGGGRRGGANQYGSYAGGYSRAGADELVDTIHGMMQDLPPETQQEAKRFIQKLEQM